MSAQSSRQAFAFVSLLVALTLLLSVDAIPSAAQKSQSPSVLDDSVVVQARRDALWNAGESTDLAPAARDDHVMVYDTFRQHTVFFGGHASSGLLNDIWEWDGATWTQKSPVSAPSARSEHAMAYDETRQRVVLFGGGSSSGWRNDTWEWDGVAWTQRFPSSSPSARAEHAMAYDANRQRVVLFGGYDLNDTWEWDGTTWIRQYPSTSPSVRRAHAMAYDSVNKRVVLFGGDNGSAWFNDTWEWDGTNWIQRYPSVNPPGINDHVMVYDNTRQRIVVFGGGYRVGLNTTWEWNGATWTQRFPPATPPGRYQHAAAYDVSRQQAVIFGGSNGNGYLSDIWGWDGTSWTPLVHAISGRVTDGGQPLAGVTVSAGSAGTATTDSNGAYTIDGLAAGTYTLTPSKSGYSFTPARLSVRVSSDMTGVNFVGVDEGSPPNAFLDLPIPYDGSAASFIKILHDTDSKGYSKGRVSSWFDHDLPTYTKDLNRQMLPYDGVTRTVLTDARYGCYDSICYDGHDGIDLTRDPKLPATQPVPIRAAASGVITATTQNCNGNCCDGNCAAGCELGNTVLLAHPNGYFTRYAHLDVVSATVGTAVAAGTPLGTMGNTGHSCGTHLHFATYRGDPLTRNYRQVDPFGWRGLTDPWVTNLAYRGPVSYLLWLHDPGATPLFDGESGAAFTDPTGAIHASVPPGVFTGPVKMELSTGLVAAPSAQLRRAGQSFWLKLLQGILAGAPGSSVSSVARAAEMTVTQPITLTVTYSDTDVLHLDVSQLSLQRWDEGANAWQPLSATLSLSDRVITATTDTLGNFDLQAPLLCPDDTTEPDDSYDSAVVITSSVISASRLFDIPGDQDWFRLNLIGGKKYIVRTNVLGPAVDTFLEIFDIDGLTVLAQDDDDGGGQASRIEWQAPRDGTYFVRVSQASGSAYGCGATYELGVEAMKQNYLPLIIRQ